tara:strand:+ start:5954 stop:6844 length:891 start_codon:yes stop_codon:yes gene_type:complete
MGLADYIWLDGVGNIHVKKKAIYLVAEVDGQSNVPVLEPWVATVTLQEGETERLLLSPAHYIPDPLRGEGNYVVLCEARNEDNESHPTNTRATLRNFVEAQGDPLGTWWGWRQGYTFGGKPTAEHYVAAERHLCACLDAGLFLHSGQVDAPSGKWSFKLGPRAFPDALDPEPPSCAQMPDNLVFGRYFLEKIARENGWGLEYTNLSVYLSTDKVRSPMDQGEDAQTIADMLLAGLKFPEGSSARFAWRPDIRIGLAAPARITTGGGHHFIEERGLDALADPYITTARILDALRSEE